MDSEPATYDPRYLAGIVLFNRGDFFEAHEVWESLWMDTSSDDKRFYQALIQAAVALCHFCNGNVRGAAKLYRSSKAYMGKYAEHHLGLPQPEFWAQMDRCCAPLVAVPEPALGLTPQEDLIPTITLDPPPADWPDPAPFLEEAE